MIYEDSEANWIASTCSPKAPTIAKTRYRLAAQPNNMKSQVKQAPLKLSLTIPQEDVEHNAFSFHLARQKNECMILGQSIVAAGLDDWNLTSQVNIDCEEI